MSDRFRHARRRVGGGGVRVRPGAGELLRDPVHGRERPARHPGEPGGGPPGAAVGHVPGRRLRRPRRPGDRPGQLPGLGGHHGLRRRSPPRRGHLHGRHPPPLLGPAGRASDAVHRLRGRRGPADTAGRRCAARAWPTAGSACCGSRSPPRTMRRRSGSRPASTGTGATSNGFRSTRKARCSLRRPGGRNGPAPAIWRSRPGPARATSSTSRCARSTPVSTSDTPPRRPTSRNLSGARCCSAVGGSPRRPCTSVPRARRCGWTSSSPSAPHATRTGPATGTLRDRCRAVLAEHREGGFDSVVAASRAVWGRLWDDCDCEVVGNVALHPRPAVLRLPPDDRGEPGRSDGQHRGERAGGGALPGSRVLGHRDLPAALLHPHPARHRQGAAALPPPHPGRRTGELPRVRHRWGALRLGVRRHRSGGMPQVHRGRRQPVLDP